MDNRHGLIAGATSTGKTKTLQVLAEQLSQNGVSLIMKDISGVVTLLFKYADENNLPLLDPEDFRKTLQYI